MNTPGGSGATPGAGGEKRGRQRAQNIVPVFIRDVTDSSGETFSVEGQEVGMVVVVGQVKRIDQQATKTVYTVQDETGDIDCVHWVEENQENAATDISENIYCRVVGAVRTSQDKRHLMVFKISPTSGTAENDGHKLDVEYAKLKIRQVKEKEDLAIGAGPRGGADGALSNSMMGGFGGGGSVGSGAGGQSYGNAKQDMVYRMVAACTREEGINRDEVAQQLSGKLTAKEVSDALDYLSGEGHVYSTVDDDHFKAIDG